MTKAVGTRSTDLGDSPDGQCSMWTDDWMLHALFKRNVVDNPLSLALQNLLDKPSAARIPSRLAPATEVERHSMVDTLELDGRGFADVPLVDDEAHDEGLKVNIHPVDADHLPRQEALLRGRWGRETLMVSVQSREECPSPVVKAFVDEMLKAGAHRVMRHHQDEAIVIDSFDDFSWGASRCPLARTIAYREAPHDFVVDMFDRLARTDVEWMSDAP